ncbi:hypothetical protein [Bacillus sp. SRB3LM]|uniref:hypothetical protein n=1 Tax=Bacillus sp. SRB3LM TaxID=2608689 RepID=UPI0018C3DCA4|nr:hypothetical protein [Bacillus sp. SRB3LM]MBG0969468.1 hypothetical protein [Bacillus sp. SRB3LM]
MSQAVHFSALHTSLTPMEWDCRKLRIMIALFEQDFSTQILSSDEQGSTIIIKVLSPLGKKQKLKDIQELINKINHKYQLHYPPYQKGCLEYIYKLSF